jgi:predicted DNA-binding transcriptional regulator YafY
MSTSSRLLALLSLLQTPRTWSGHELADRLEVSRRTVRRDVDRLRGLGYPVEGTLGADGGYRLGAGSEIPPLLLDDDEAVAIVIGLRTAAIQAVAGIDEASARALVKLEQVLPARLRTRFEGLRAATSPIDWSRAPSVDPAVLTVVARAISGREQLRFTYRTANGASGRRSVEPRALVVLGRRWYLVAWDQDREDWRIFRADRIEDPWSTGRPLPQRELPGGLDAAAYVRERQLSQAPTYRMVATLHAPFEHVGPRAGDAISDIEPIDAGRCRITSQGDTLEWLAIRLILLDCDFEIHEPRELVEYLGRLAERLGRRGSQIGRSKRERPRRPRAASRPRSSPS